MSTAEIKLYTLGGAFGLRNVSPFCFKIELLLTHLGLPFEHIAQPDPRKAPKGKLPYAEINGEIIADSDIIMNKLDEITQGQVYGSLTPQQKAYGLALTRLAEEHLYWIMVASRWLDDTWFPNVKEAFFKPLAPGPLVGLVSKIARGQVKKTYDLHGLGKHTLEEQKGFARRDMQALQDAVGDGPFLFGETPSIFDFAITGLLSGLYGQQPATWINPIGDEFPALKAYTERVQAHLNCFAREG